MAATRASPRASTTYLEPHLLSNGIEVSVHSCPRALRRDLESVFPGMKLRDVVLVPTAQRATRDLVEMGDEVEHEKDRLLEIVRNKRVDDF